VHTHNRNATEESNTHRLGSSLAESSKEGPKVSVKPDGERVWMESQVSAVTSSPSLLHGLHVSWPSLPVLL
jgi:hypothetical protein